MLTSEYYHLPGCNCAAPSPAETPKWAGETRHGWNLRATLRALPKAAPSGDPGECCEIASLAGPFAWRIVMICSMWRLSLALQFQFSSFILTQSTWERVQKTHPKIAVRH